MAKQFPLVPSKTYASEANAVAAVNKKYGNNEKLNFIIVPTVEGRFFPVFIGERAILEGVHFHFNVVG